MNFYKMLLAVCMMLPAGLQGSKKRNMVIEHEGKDYTLALNDLEAYIQKESGYELTIRVDAPEVLNGAEHVLVLHNPQLTGYDSRSFCLECGISKKSWSVLQDKAGVLFHKRQREEFAKMKQINWVAGFMAPIVAAGIYMIPHNNPDISQAEGIALKLVLAAATTLLLCNLPGVGGRTYNDFERTWGWAEHRKDILFGFEKWREDADYVYVRTTFPVDAIPYGENTK